MNINIKLEAMSIQSLPKLIKKLKKIEKKLPKNSYLNVDIN